MMRNLIIALFLISCGRPLNVGSFDAGSVDSGSVDAGLLPFDITDARDVETNRITLRSERRALLIGTGFAAGTTATLVLNAGPAERAFSLVIDAAQSTSERLVVTMPALVDADGIAMGDSGPALLRPALPSTAQTASKGVSLERSTASPTAQQCVESCGITSCDAPGRTCYSDGEVYCSSCIATCYGATPMPKPTIERLEALTLSGTVEASGFRAGEALIAVGTNFEGYAMRSATFDGVNSMLLLTDPADPTRRAFAQVPLSLTPRSASTVIFTTKSGCTASAIVSIAAPADQNQTIAVPSEPVFEDSVITLTGTSLDGRWVNDVRIGGERARILGETETTLTVQVPNFDWVLPGSLVAMAVTVVLHDSEVAETSTFAPTALRVRGIE